MIITSIIVGLLSFAAIVIIIVVAMQEIEDKKIFQLMQSKGVVLVITKENSDERNAIMQLLSLPVRVYINGPDQTSIMPRYRETFHQFVKLSGGGLLFDVWVGRGSMRNKSARSDSTPYVVEYIDGKITHFVKGKNYINNGGSFDGLPNAVFKTVDPAKYSFMNKLLRPIFETISNILKLSKK